MKKNRIFLLLFLIIPTISFAGKDVTKITKAEAYLYQEDPWEYLERVFDNVEESPSVTKTIVDNLMRAIIAVPAAASTIFAYIASDGTFSDFKNGAILLNLLAGLISVPIYLGSKVLTSDTFLFERLWNRISKERWINIIEGILKKYNPHLNEEDEEKLNYKKVIPEEFHDLFDGLHKKYLKHGKKYLKKHNLHFIDLIRQKIRDRYEYPTMVRVINY